MFVVSVVDVLLPPHEHTIVDSTSTTVQPFIFVVRHVKPFNELIGVEWYVLSSYVSISHSGSTFACLLLFFFVSKLVIQVYFHKTAVLVKTWILGLRCLGSKVFKNG